MQEKLTEFEYGDPALDKFFDGDFEDIAEWSDGKGRGEGDYTIFTDGTQFILRAEHHAFYGETIERYYLINPVKLEREPEGEGKEIWESHNKWVTDYNGTLVLSVVTELLVDGEWRCFTEQFILINK